MASLHFFIFFFISSLPTQPNANPTKTHIPKPLINITKHFTFPNFNPLQTPTLSTSITLLGSSTLSPNSSSIQITSNLRFQAGRALFSSPIRLFDPQSQTPASFTTTFTFQFINTSSSISGSNGGSGLTFIIVPDELTLGRPGPWLAVMNDACDDDYKAIAVEFDTRKNTNFGDPNDNHVGIDLGSVVSTHLINASDVGVDLKDGSVHKAWIGYHGVEKRLEIKLGGGGDGGEAKMLFCGEVDLSGYLHEYMFVGFSASTGSLTEIHHVLSWSFSSVSEARLRVPMERTCEGKIAVDGGGMVYRTAPSSFLIFVAVVVLCLVVLVNLYCNGRRGGDGGDERSGGVVVVPRPLNKARRFGMAEVMAATRGFSEVEMMSSDARGECYRGSLGNGGCYVMVMRFSPRVVSSVGVDRRRVMKEVGLLSRVRHPNLVAIRGWCVDNKEMMVVYDYLPNGSLDRWLFGLGVLPWSRRYKVVKDVAESLCYLHSSKFVHRNVRTGSVFLDITFRAVLGDFGFGIVVPNEFIRVETVVAQNADVFAFGVVLLEVVAGRRNSDTDLGSGDIPMSLVDFAWRMHEKGELLKVVDRRMGPIFTSEQAVRVLEVGLLCTISDTKSGPSMEQVVGYLNVERPIPKLPMRRPVTLFPYSSATDLCIGYSCTPF